MTNNRITFTECMKRAAWVLFIVIIGYLLIASIFSTCYLGGYSYRTGSGTTEINVEHTFYIRDNFIQHLVVFVLFSFLLLSRKIEKLQNIFCTKYFWTLLCIAGIGVISVLIVMSGGMTPKFDQKHVVDAAAALNHHDYSDFGERNYLFIFPFQTGIVLYYQILSLLFGSLNYMAFEIVNAVWIVLSYYLLVKISGLLWSGKEQYGAGVAIICLLFLPYLLYITFFYGTVVGMAFALLSFYMMFVYEQKPKIFYLLLCGVSMGIAIVIKSNYIIFMIAQMIYLLLSCFSDKIKDFKKIYPRLLLTATLLVCFALGRFGVDAYIRSMNQGTQVKGIPMTAWVAMGLQDGKAAPGWFNGYNVAVYEANDYDYEKTEAAVRDEIKRIVTGYPQDITTSISFFVKKVSSQWNNPTFQSLWVLEDRDGQEGMEWLLSGRGRYLYIFWVNLLQTWILAGVFIYALMRFKTGSLKEILLPVTFIGGFLFHLFWEAEGLYAILYFPTLLPLSICGYGEWRRWLLERKYEITENGWKTKAGKRLQKQMAAGALAVVMICALSYTDPFAKLLARNENTGAFDTYTQETVNEEEALPEQ